MRQAHLAEAEHIATSPTLYAGELPLQNASLTPQIPAVFRPRIGRHNSFYVLLFSHPQKASLTTRH
jgi:hypothetical protein